MTGALTVYRREKVGPQQMPAAEYLRMSAHHQRYSMANQREAIRIYARDHGMVLVKTYADGAKSGLTLEGRAGLQQLLDDVWGGAAGYKAVLVYDVSRWGRFQDTDESAAYEFICRRAGIRVIYCGELFSEVDEATGEIMKWAKRSMAGEFSRELGEKAYRGHCRLAGMGYHQGASAPYGLRRLCKDEKGEARLVMQRGESKLLKTDRVVLVPGPVHEQRIVRMIYRRFADQKRSMPQIVAELNAKGAKNALGRPWQTLGVCRILHNERYAGTFLWNQNRSRLKTARRRNDPALWIRLEEAIDPIVPKALWERAQRRHASFARHPSYDQKVLGLSKLLTKQGRLTSALIEAEATLPSPASYRRQFGSLERAYRAAGFVHRDKIAWHESHKRNAVIRHRVTADLLQWLSAEGHVLHSCGGLVCVDNGLRIALVTAVYQKMRSGNVRWVIHRRHYKEVELCLAIRADPVRNEIMDYYLLPNADKTVQYTNVGTSETAYRDIYRTKSLAPLIELINLSFGDAQRFLSGLAQWTQDNCRQAGVES